MDTLTLEEKRKLSLEDFKRKLPQKPQSLADMLHKVFNLGLKAGIEIGLQQKEVLND